MKTIIEVGANSGQDSIKYLSDGDTFLYAFEPVPYLGDNLIKLLDLLKKTRRYLSRIKGSKTANTIKQKGQRLSYF